MNNNSRRKFLKNSALSFVALNIQQGTKNDEINELNEREGALNKDEIEDVLFGFDDYSIPWKHNLKFTLVEAEKYPNNPVVKRGIKDSADFGHAILYGTVIKQGDKFKMWYLGMPDSKIQKNGQAAGFWRPMCYAESLDGINWIKPKLGLVELNGDKENNICLIEGTPYSLTRVNDFFSVLYEPDDPDPDKRYKVAYIATLPVKDVKEGFSNIVPKNTERIAAVVCATSADGFSWKVVGSQPLNAGGEQFEGTSLHRFEGFYYVTGQAFSPSTWMPDGEESGRVMIAYRSPDFVNWSKFRCFSFARRSQFIEAGSAANQKSQVHMGAGIWNRNNVLIGLYGMYEAAQKKTDNWYWLDGVRVNLGLIISNDGIHFREPVNDFKVISRGSANEWDNVALLQANAFVNEGEKTMIWYSHWDTSGNLKSMEIGLALLRKDGFGYLSKMHSDVNAVFATKFLDYNYNTKLFINVEGVSADLPLIVELLDSQDKEIESYAGDDCAKIITNGTSIEVSWRRAKYLPLNRKFAIQVKFPVDSMAKVYSLYVRPA